MEKAQDGEKRKTANNVEEADKDEVDPRQILEDLLKRTEEMEKRLARILEECENLGVFDNDRDRRGFRPRFFGR